MGFAKVAVAVAMAVAVVGWVTAAAAAEEESMYGELRERGLPVGLLPKGITEYWVDPATGRFQINLTEACEVVVDPDNPLHFEANVSGRLGAGSIGEVSGMSQQDLFLWLPVRGIRVDSGGLLVHFDVGVVHKQLPLSLFDSPLDCSPSPSPQSDDGESRQRVVAVGSGEQGDEEGSRAVF